MRLLAPLLDHAAALIEQGELSLARAVCATLERKAPDAPEVALLLGVLALKSDDPSAAVTYLEKAVGQAPAHGLMGQALLTLGQYERAAEMFAAQPDDSQAQANRGLCLYHLGRGEEARTTLEEAARRWPDSAEINLALGRVNKRLGRLAEAEAAYRAALVGSPDHPLATIFFGRLLREQDRPEEAVALLGAYQDRTGDVTFAATRVTWLLAEIPTSLDHLTRIRAHYEEEALRLRTLEGPVREDMLIHATPNFMGAYQGVDDRAFQEAFAAFYRRNCPGLSFTAPHIAKPRKGERLRVGFLSLNFRNHTIGKLYRGIIAHLSRAEFEVVVFGGAPKDELGREIAVSADRFIELPPTVARARAVVAVQELDVLYYADLGMDTLPTLLAFARLARVQCVSWGHPMTSGLETIDAFISAEEMETPDAQTRYREKLIRLSLPPTYLYPIAEVPREGGPDLSFAKGRTVYGCLQSLFKVHPDFDAVLMDILRRDPNGVAVFIGAQAGWSKVLHRRWTALDAEAAARVHFLPPMNQKDFLVLLRSCDVVLDTIHFCGGISTVEALSQGVPVVTWANSPLMAARVGVAYYREMGVDDCIATSAEDYAARAVRLGTDPAWRAEVVARIKAHRPRLYRRQEVLDELSAFFTKAVAP